LRDHQLRRGGCGSIGGVGERGGGSIAANAEESALEREVEYRGLCTPTSEEFGYVQLMPGESPNETEHHRQTALEDVAGD
jgi:hypothetical protein